ncbi:hypothetical protein [Ammoniphilus sp. 3BR4]|uniref:hypothetical protein n=1 Tax=Ammoniphilus sp. 3BR4 TaxID=3158265 RepID=UPI003465F782
MDHLFFERDKDKAKKFNQERLDEAKKFNQERVEQQEEINDQAYHLKKEGKASFDPDYIDG